MQAYLQLNGYFTSAEYPIIASAGRTGVRTITDIDVASACQTTRVIHEQLQSGVSTLPSGVAVRLVRSSEPRPRHDMTPQRHMHRYGRGRRK